MHYEKLFEKGTIGRLELRNRVVMTAMGTMLGDWNGCSTPEQVRFYEERAKGGCGLIIPEFTSVDPDSGHCNRIQLGIWDARQISSFERICDAVHRHGAKIFVQLHHGGREAPRRSTAAVRPWRRAWSSTAWSAATRSCRAR